MSVGENIKRIRKEKGYSIMKIRELTGLSKSTISDIENGKSSPTIETLSKISKALDVEIINLFSEHSNTNNEHDIESSKIDDPGLQRIRLARNKMDDKSRDKMMKILEASFDDFFNE